MKLRPASFTCWAEDCAPDLSCSTAAAPCSRAASLSCSTAVLADSAACCVFEPPSEVPELEAPDDGPVPKLPVDWPRPEAPADCPEEDPPGVMLPWFMGK